MQRLAARSVRLTRPFCSSAMALDRPAWNEWRLNPPFAAPKGSPLLQYQESLPSFPIPDLGDTVAKALRSARPLARDEAEYTDLEKKGREFIQGRGSELQAKLQDRRDNTRNWLAEWWDDLAYMGYRDSVVHNVSYFYGFEKLPQGADKDYSRDNPAYVAASITLSAINFRDQLIDGSLPPDEAGKIPQDMAHYEWMMNACRIPLKPSDYAVKIKEDSPEGNHFIVIRRNHFYKVPINGSDGKRPSLKVLEKIFQWFYDNTPNRSALAIGNLTAADRDLWADAREHMLASSTSSSNSQSLHSIEKAAFVVCLDENKPTSGGSSEQQVEFSRALWHGDGHNRFWDKPIQYVIFENGESGLIGEHSCMDGSPTARMANDMTLDLMAGKLPKETAAPSTSPATPELLSFDIDDHLKNYIAESEKQLQKAIGQFDIQYLLFDQYGKNEIKAQKTSPDAWVQMIMQLAYAMTFKTVAGTYEAASARRFDLGRTETVRVCTKEVKSWTDSMMDDTRSNGERQDLFKAAVAQHGKDMKEAGSGKGLDRHLFGLRCLLAEGEPVPDFLNDPLLKRSSTWTLSTSQIVGEHFTVYGWGPPVDFGFGYLLRNKNLQFTVSSRKGLPLTELMSNIETAANQLMALMANDKKLPHAKL